MFRFAHPEYLYALYIIPVLIGIFWLINRKRKKVLENFAEKKLHNVLLPAYSSFKEKIKLGVLTLAIVFLIIAAAIISAPFGSFSA